MPYVKNKPRLCEEENCSLPVKKLSKKVGNVSVTYIYGKCWNHQKEVLNATDGSNRKGT